ncbi:uncharacterized protein LOC9634594 isoform X1 [Selaginella moellendorffii]|uniref:uncharacterized protein LOC9634594 isoform X1 n=1 Tax=Selaginella moellendorffii TaxID=88036 RepID=UPI000D1C7E07|nr:uncharacterized protein LOC9634594 isoform X1 [Selaginella moellendorffii]|eukprot:XP_024542691.1 uncharacterized protein LOC9634594 isoform X1 [Selaginella moellendorffii]
MTHSIEFAAPLLCSSGVARLNCCCSSQFSPVPAAQNGRRAFVLSSGLVAGLFTSVTEGRENLVSVWIGLTSEWLLLVHPDARAGLEKYMKKKKLDPLETYIPGIILCQSQFQELEAKLGGEKVEYQDARALLRSGPAGSLRSNIRAVAEYASESGDGAAAADAVKLCLRSLEDLDSLLLRRSRDDTSITVDSMKAKLGTSMQALDRLLQTVPQPILEQGKAAAMAFLDDTPEVVTDDVDIKSLEDLITTTK